MTLSRVVLCVFTAIAAIAAIACSDEDSGPSFEELVESASYVRELPLLYDVAVVEMTRQEWMDHASANADELNDEFLERYADTYGRLGYFPEGADLRPLFAGSTSSWVAASYSPSAKRITLIGDTRPDVVVHEIVHALQDQHFDLQEFDGSPTSDAWLARRAVVEGDAILAQFRYVANFEYGFELERMNWQKSFESRRQRSATTLRESGYPPIFMAYAASMYSFGFEYATGNLLDIVYKSTHPPLSSPHDWELQNKLFTEHPPTTMQQVFRYDYLEEYLPAPEWLPPIDEGRDEQTLGPYRIIETDTMGEWYTYLLFFQLQESGFYEAQEEAREIAAAWRGDRVFFLELIIPENENEAEPPNDEVEPPAYEKAILWKTAWATPQGAENFVTAIKKVHNWTNAETSPFMGANDDGEIMWIEQREHTVIIAINISPALVESLVALEFMGIERKGIRHSKPLARWIHEHLPLVH